MISDVEAYIKNIAVLMIISTAAGIAAPEKYKKYLDFACALILVLAAAAPLMKLSKTDFPSFDSDYGAGYFNTGGYSANDNILKETTEKRLDEDIKSELALFGVECASVSTKAGDDFFERGSIESVKVVLNKKTDMDIASYIKERYAADKVEVVNK